MTSSTDAELAYKSWVTLHKTEVNGTK